MNIEHEFSNYGQCQIGGMSAEKLYVFEIKHVHVSLF